MNMLYIFFNLMNSCSSPDLLDKLNMFLASSTDAPIDGMIKDICEFINRIAGNVVFKSGSDLSSFFFVISFVIILFLIIYISRLHNLIF